MATLASDDLSLEIRYRDFQHGWIQYEVFFRWQGEIILNDAILKRQGEYLGVRGRGGVLANEDEKCCILPTLEKVLETNEPDYCETIEPDIVLAIYPEQYFPFLSRQTGIGSRERGIQEGPRGAGAPQGRARCPAR